MKDGLKLFLASGFYLGLAPIVPGSFGAIPALAWFAVAYFASFSPLVTWLWCFAGVVFFSVLHYILTPWAQKRWNDPDPSHFVLDEVVGALCVPLFCLPLLSFPYPVEANFSFAGFYLPWPPLAGFVIFRILDAIKLPGARYIDKNIHTASGVLFDDVVSAAYSAAILWALMEYLLP
jgi:phosphatidylglycerophosphatase A